MSPPAPRFRIDGAAPHMPDPMTVNWASMNPMDVALSGRGIIQGRYRVTITWELMADEDFTELMDIWIAKAANGYRIATAVVPPYRSNNNANWDTVSGGVGGYMLMREPTIRSREILQVSLVSLTLDNVARP